MSRKFRRALCDFAFIPLAAFALVSILNEGWERWVFLTVVFVGIPILDFAIGITKFNPSPELRKIWEKPLYWFSPLLVYIASHFLVLICGGVTALNSSWWTVLSLALVVGVYTGGLGITVAHELCHRSSRSARALADLLLLSVCYHHFAVEHVSGHHLRVATSEDPASAPAGMGSYEFLKRSVSRSLSSALALEEKRTGRRYHLRNRVVLGLAIELLIFVVSISFSLKLGAFFLAQSSVAIALLELVNYVEHYGLSRVEQSPGKYERVQPHHSWNSSHLVSNAVFFNLQRHSDHHASAFLPFTVLRHHDDVPQLPSGYPAMVILALAPPLWKRVMDPRLLRLRSSKPIEAKSKVV